MKCHSEAYLASTPDRVMGGLLYEVEGAIMTELWEGVAVIVFVIVVCELFLIPRNSSKALSYGITIFVIGLATLITNSFWGLPVVGFGLGSGYTDVSSPAKVSMVLVVVGLLLITWDYLREKYN